MRSRLGAVLVLASGLLGCRGVAPATRHGRAAIPPLTQVQVQAAGLSESEVRAAAALCNLKCLKCHGFYDPAGYHQPDWDRWMAKMSHKARLNPERQELLTRYLAAFRNGARANERMGGGP